MQKVFALVFIIAYSVYATPAATNTNCALFCPQIWAPICATDGSTYKQFSSNCHMTAEACNRQITLTTVDMDFCTTKLVEDLISTLDATDVEKSNCDSTCTRDLEPVCISNGSVRGLLSNKCVAKYFICVSSTTDTSNEFRVIGKESC